MRLLRLASDFVAAVTGNWISIIGALLTTAVAVLIVTFLFLDLLGFHGGPYLGILTFLILPVLMVLGLAWIGPIFQVIKVQLEHNRFGRSVLE